MTTEPSEIRRSWLVFLAAMAVMALVYWWEHR